MLIFFFLSCVFIFIEGFNEVVIVSFFIYIFSFLCKCLILLIDIVIFVVMWWLLNLLINCWWLFKILNMEICLIDFVEFLVWFWFLLIFKINVGSVYVFIILDVIIFNIFLCYFFLVSKRNKWFCLICFFVNNNVLLVILDIIFLCLWLKCLICLVKNFVFLNLLDNKSLVVNDVFFSLLIVFNWGLIIKLIVFFVILLLKFVWFKIVFMDDGVWLFNIFNFCFIIYLFLFVNDIKFVIVFMVVNVMKCWGGCFINFWVNL